MTVKECWAVAGSKRNSYFAALAVGCALMLGCKSKPVKPKTVMVEPGEVQALKVEDMGSAPATWFRFVIHSDEYKIPFTASFADGEYTIHTGDSSLNVPGVYSNELIDFRFPVLGVTCRLERHGNNYKGDWSATVADWKPLKMTGRVKEGTGGPLPLFDDVSEEPKVDFTGGWDVDMGEMGKGIATFVQDEFGTIKGTLLPPDQGDLRHLEGVVEGESARLATFDGNHAYWVELNKNSEGFRGVWHYAHIASFDLVGTPRNKNKSFEVSTLRLKKGKTKLTLPLADEFKGEPLLVDYFGTWCPVCMDLTPVLKSLHEKYEPKGLKTLSIAWEFEDPDVAEARLKEYRDVYGVDWPIKLKVASDLTDAIPPEVENAIGFPLLFFIRRDGTVAGMHAGFVSEALAEERRSSMAKIEGYIQDIVISKPLTNKGRQ